MSFNFDKNIVDKILEQIFPIPEEFGIGGTIGENLISHIKYKLEQINEFIYVERGMTKLVIIPPNCNYVIKIPFNGHYYDNEFYFFEEAANEEDFSDYCLTEYIKYQQLKKENLECFVAKTVYYKTIDNTRIFIQEKVIPLDSPWAYSNISIPNPSENSKKIVSSIFSNDNIMDFYDTEWASNCVELYGAQKTKNFFLYCSMQDPDIIEDFHDGNYGYRKNGEPVILDYSNYSG